ncbi:Calcium-activated chloride channel regulator 3A-1, partial [Fragariocoptes setiger]
MLPAIIPRQDYGRNKMHTARRKARYKEKEVEWSEIKCALESDALVAILHCNDRLDYPSYCCMPTKHRNSNNNNNNNNHNNNDDNDDHHHQPHHQQTQNHKHRQHYSDRSMYKPYHCTQIKRAMEKKLITTETLRRLVMVMFILNMESNRYQSMSVHCDSLLAPSMHASAGLPQLSANKSVPSRTNEAADKTTTTVMPQTQSRHTVDALLASLMKNTFYVAPRSTDKSDDERRVEQLTKDMKTLFKLMRLAARTVSTSASSRRSSSSIVDTDTTMTTLETNDGTGGAGRPRPPGATLSFADNINISNADYSNDHNSSDNMERSGNNILSHETNNRGLTRQSRAAVSRLLRKADWNTLFVKLAKVFLQYFLDLILNDMFGTTGSASRSFVSTDVDLKGSFREFLPIQRIWSVQASQATIVRDEYTGAYSGLTIAIDDRVSQAVDKFKFVQDIQRLIQDSSQLLYEAMNGRAYIAEVNILIPYSWNKSAQEWMPKPGAPIIKERRAQRQQVDVIIGLDDPTFGNKMYTVQHDECGHGGLEIRVPASAIAGNTYASITTAAPITGGDLRQSQSLNLESEWTRRRRAARQFVRQWAMYRYGVFAENGFAHDPMYPDTYAPSGVGSAHSILTRCELDANETSLLVDDSLDNVSHEPHSSAGEFCGENFVSLLPSISTIFASSSQHSGHVGSTIASSNNAAIPKIASSAYHSLNSAGSGVTWRRHDARAPTKHNVLCHERSVMDVIKTHPDFASILGTGRHSSQFAQSSSFPASSFMSLKVLGLVSHKLPLTTLYRELRLAPNADMPSSHDFAFSATRCGDLITSLTVVAKCKCLFNVAPISSSTSVDYMAYLTNHSMLVASST